MKFNKPLMGSLLLGTGIAAAASANAEQTTGKEDLNLEQRIERLEQQQTANTASLGSLAKKVFEERVQFNGFFSTGLSDVSGPYSYAGKSNDISLLPNTWLGLQMDIKLYDGGQFVAQAIAEGNDVDSFDIDFEWLYYRHVFGAGFSAQLGRVRLPVFMESENYYVGTTYPWVTAPVEVYQTLPLTSVDGISVDYRGYAGDWTFDLKSILWGSNEYELGTIGSVEVDNLSSLTFAATNDALTLQLSYFQARLTYNLLLVEERIPASFVDDKSYVSGGIKYDDANWYFSAEVVDANVRKGVLAEDFGYYVTLGKYFGNWLPYISFAQTDTKNAKDMIRSSPKDLTGDVNRFIADSAFKQLVKDGLPEDQAKLGAQAFADATLNGVQLVEGHTMYAATNRTQKSYGTGVKFDFKANTTFKMQVQYVEGFDGSVGHLGLESIQTMVNNVPAIPGSSGYNPEFDGIWVYDLAVQAVF